MFYDIYLAGEYTLLLHGVFYAHNSQTTYQWDKCVDFNRTSGMVIYYKNNVYCGFARRKTLIVLTYVTITASKQLAVFCISSITF